MSHLVAIAVLAYAAGCVVAAYYIVRARTGADIRASGSGTAGARNVLRTGDAPAALLTLLWDALKGAAAVWLATRMSARPSAPAIAFMFVTIGHIWPIQLGFRGGKGVATALGCTLTIAVVARSWPAVAGASVAWLLVLFAHRPSRRRRAAARNAGVALALATEEHRV